MANTLWHPASEQPRERTQPLLLAAKTTWRDKDGKMLQGISPTTYFLGCYADGQFWDEIGEIGDLPITFNKQIQRFQEYTWMD